MKTAWENEDHSVHTRVAVYDRRMPENTTQLNKARETNPSEGSQMTCVC